MPNNKQKLKVAQVLYMTDATVGGLNAAVIAQINTLGTNTIGTTDVAGTPIGTQSVLPGSIGILPVMYGYDSGTPTDVFTGGVTWEEFVQLT